MKTRHGFVSNSSSSSFVINPAKLTFEQLDNIKKYLDIECEDKWDVHYNEKCDIIRGFTCMDNEYFSEWLERNGLIEYVIFEGENW